MRKQDNILKITFNIKEFLVFYRKNISVILQKMSVIALYIVFHYIFMRVIMYFRQMMIAYVFEQIAQIYGRVERSFAYAHRNLTYRKL